uniref:Uncharacterized protein n=1 Tax=viral metagenome TaxID=1070528 RepID=A0A6H2A4I8_9ZZZZ
MNKMDNLSDADTQIATIIQALQHLFPNGHSSFIPICIEEMELHSRKNYDYAHGGNPLGNFYRVAEWLGQYSEFLKHPMVIALIYAAKQIDDVLWMISQGYEGQVEGIESRLGDVSVYSKLARILHKEETKNCD